MRGLKESFSKLRLHLKLGGNYDFIVIGSAFEKNLKKIGKYTITTITDKEGEVIIKTFYTRILGVGYEISLTAQEFGIFAENSFQKDEKLIFQKFFEYLKIFKKTIDSVEKEGNIIYVEKSTLVTYFSDGDIIMSNNDILTDVEVISNGSIGMVAKYDRTTSNYLIFKSYFIDNVYNFGFFNNPSFSFKLLYNMLDSMDVLFL